MATVLSGLAISAAFEMDEVRSTLDSLVNAYGTRGFGFAAKDERQLQFGFDMVIRPEVEEYMCWIHVYEAANSLKDELDSFKAAIPTIRLVQPESFSHSLS